MYPVKYYLNTDYEEMEILGVTGLFTNFRIDAESLPEGFYKYSLRDGGDALFSSIESNVFVNHTGDFICKTEIDLGPNSLKDVDEDDWGFTDEDVDLDKFFGVDIKTKVAEVLDMFMQEVAPYEYADSLPTGTAIGEGNLVDEIRAMLNDREQTKGILTELKEICEEVSFADKKMEALAEDLMSKVSEIESSFPEVRTKLVNQIDSAESLKGKAQADDEQLEPVVSEP